MDIRRRLLLRDGVLVPLAPKVFETLLVLVRNNGRVMTKEELISTVWPDTFVEESNLAQHIFLLRKALGEEKGEHRYIVTAPSVGYRFVAQVTESALPGSAPREQSQNWPDRAAGVGATISMAVLPFKPLDAAGGDEFLGLGIADALIMRLSGLRLVQVRPTTAVLRYAEPNQDPLVAGRELSVDALLDGGYQRYGEQIRVSVQLIRVKDAVTLWAAKFDESFRDIFAIQDSISEQIARALELKLSGEERRQLRKNYTDDPEALQAYIKGRYFWNKRTAQNLRKGIEYAYQAIEIDPAYAPAYVGLADCYNLLAGHGGLPPLETFPKAKAAALRALEIDETLSEAYSSLGFVHYRFDWNWSAAEENFRRSIELKPNYPTAHHWYGESLLAQGRFEESIAEMKRALELDPLSLPINTDLAQSFFFSRRYDLCEEQMRKTLEMDQNFVRACIIAGMSAEQRGLYQEAVLMFRKAAELSDNNPLALSGLGHALAAAGNVLEARQVLNQLLRLSERQYVSHYNLAVIYLGLGEKDLAYELLEKAIEHRDVWLVWLKVNPKFDSMRREARFAELLRRVGLADSHG
jgi:DNA-binding winged helix-turn-helix (wHTH) protein/tetratricopeptide (TPR) repeat protein